jgi:hypothetical protein
MTDTKETKLFEKSQTFGEQTIEDVVPRTGPAFQHRRHEEPVPRQTTKDISQCPDINEWVLNHLPLQEHQKEKLIQQLRQDQINEDRKKKKDEWKVRVHRPRARLISVTKSDKSGDHTGVKTLTKTS